MYSGSPPTVPPLNELSSGAKSLFWNILPVSPCGSRFCVEWTATRTPKCFEMIILGKVKKKKLRRYYATFHRAHLLGHSG